MLVLGVLIWVVKDVVIFSEVLALGAKIAGSAPIFSLLMAHISCITLSVAFPDLSERLLKEILAEPNPAVRGDFPLVCG